MIRYFALINLILVFSDGIFAEGYVFSASNWPTKTEQIENGLIGDGAKSQPPNSECLVKLAQIGSNAIARSSMLYAGVGKLNSTSNQFIKTIEEGNLENVATDLGVTEAGLKAYLLAGEWRQYNWKGAPLQNSAGVSVRSELILERLLERMDGGENFEEAISKMAIHFDFPVEKLKKYILKKKWLAPKPESAVLDKAADSYPKDFRVGSDKFDQFLDHYAAATRLTRAETIKELSEHEPRPEVINAMMEYFEAPELATYFEERLWGGLESQINDKYVMIGQNKRKASNFTIVIIKNYFSHLSEDGKLSIYELINGRGSNWVPEAKAVALTANDLHFDKDALAEFILEKTWFNPKSLKPPVPMPEVFTMEKAEDFYSNNGQKLTPKKIYTYKELNRALANYQNQKTVLTLLGISDIEWDAYAKKLHLNNWYATAMTSQRPLKLWGEGTKSLVRETYFKYTSEDAVSNLPLFNMNIMKLVASELKIDVADVDYMLRVLYEADPSHFKMKNDSKVGATVKDPKGVRLRLASELSPKEMIRKYLQEGPDAIYRLEEAKNEETKRMPDGRFVDILYKTIQASKAPVISKSRDLKPGSAMAKMFELPGLGRIADELAKIETDLKNQKSRKEQGLEFVVPSLHARFEGNPGTGKTTVARIYGEMLKELGYLKGKDGKIPVVEVGVSDLIGAVVGESTKKTNEKIEEAMGGVLILDELYALNPGKNQYGKEVTDVLLKAMEDKRGEFVVIGTGYTKEMEEFINTNPGFNRRFPQRLFFEDYDDKTLGLILNSMAKKGDYKIPEDVVTNVIQNLARQRGPGFGNAGSVRNLFETAVRNQATRLRDKENATKEDFVTLTLEDFTPPKRSRKVALAQLDKMTGLTEVKESVHQLVRLLELEDKKAKHGIKSNRPLLNAIFAGNPGTGKTTVAKIYGQILKDLGYLTNGEVLLVKAGDLIGDVLGASETKTKEILERAKGKVLVIDEAYLLYRPDGGSGGNTFGRAALDALVSAINPDANQDMVVILTGYPKEMELMLTANPGLSRRFPERFHFADYNDDSLAQILRKNAIANGFKLGDEAVKAAVQELAGQRAGKDFGNAGAVETLLGKAQLRQSSRFEGKDPSKAELSELIASDLVPPRPNPEDRVAEIEKMVGLSQVKDEIQEIKAVLDLAKERGENPRDFFEPYTFFSGPVGTGKETVADHMGPLYYSLGVLPSPQVVKVSADDLIAPYQGQTASKTQQVLEGALGKTLYLKDVGRLTNRSNPYNREALDTLAQFMSQNEGRLAVILSGEENDIEALKAVHQGIGNLMQRHFDFHDLSVEESGLFFSNYLKEKNRVMSREAKEKLPIVLKSLKSTPGWSNGDDLQNFYKKVLAKQAVRQSRSKEEKKDSIEAEDLESALEAILKSRKVSSSFFPTVQSNHEPLIQLAEAAPPLPKIQVATGKAESKKEVQTKSEPEVNGKESEKNGPKIKVEHKHEHETKTNIQVSKATQKTMQLLEEASKKQNISNDLIEDAFQTGNASPQLAEKVAEQLKEKGGPLSVNKVLEDLNNALKEAKEAIDQQREKEASEAKAKGKPRKEVLHYVCKACGRTNCHYMPYYWTTYEDE